MTEAEWSACEEPEALAYSDIKASDRKWRLVLCACSRRIRKQMTEDRSRIALDLSERFADGLISDEELGAVGAAAQIAWVEVSRKYGDSLQRAAAAAAAYSSQRFICDNDRSNAMGAVAEAFPKAARRTVEQCAQAQIIRDIFGNPFRPVIFSPDWRTPTATTLASQMYESRDFGAMPILADALQDAGCDSDDVLNHCCGSGPHVRGCWVVDLVLGKE
ncbi:Uncharacterized protein OS=Sorangium cellulosum (strain So ce56) GN=sce5710 PE=4 SV=1 [Gemmata massiliana]|uniref:SMI1/KNR4 family protein n=1 Tax=Gemmata massiliana TaxID=1210884 RepID=A0A6P2CSR2_9BACT|nr:hypothetical protein [Gemmata massiliana]VTR91971.1 Uncharacterized protein OS=Sorangium cellulosum (strain So ce56) GN=sce5710 PE=4 SV=1 [Gemmata massiliana]